jgi:hypothetical protein
VGERVEHDQGVGVEVGVAGGGRRFAPVGEHGVEDGDQVGGVHVEAGGEVDQGLDRLAVQAGVAVERVQQVRVDAE